MISASASTRRLVLLSMITAGGLVVFVFESFIPLFPVMPFLKPGLGNVATLLALMIFGFGDAVKVTVLRIVLGALILGRLFSPLFLMSLTGGLASVIVMGFVVKNTGRIFGPVGISVLGAVAHNIVQLFVAYFFVKSAGIIIFIPVFIGAGIIAGILVGLITVLLFEKTETLSIFDPVWLDDKRGRIS